MPVTRYQGAGSARCRGRGPYMSERQDVARKGANSGGNVKTEAEHLDLERVLVVLRRRWWVIALVTVLVTGATFAFSERQQKQYTAMASVLFFSGTQIDPQTGLPTTSSSTTVDPAAQATAVQQISHQPGIAQATARIVGHGLSRGAASRSISVTQQGQANIANISATSPSPTLAAAIANTYASQYIKSQRTQAQAAVLQALHVVKLQISALSRQQLAGPSGQALLDRAESLRIDSNLENGGVQLLSPAQVPSSPSSPKVTRNTALGLLLGLLFGLLAAFLLERFDRRIKNVEELEATYRVPLLGVVPHNKAYVLPPQANGGIHQGDKEVFKLLRAYLRYFNVDRDVHLLMVASAAPGDGKTTIAHNLAEAAQEMGTKTLLMEGDLRRSNLAAHYRLPTGPGLSELLTGGATLSEAIRSVPIASRLNGSRSEVMLDVLVAGHAPPNPTELVQSHAMADVLAWGREQYDLVVIDTPPLAVVADAIALLKAVDGVVLVAQLGKNTRDAAAFLRERLVGVNAPLLGVVANGVKARKGGYGYGYGYYAADGGHVSPLQSGAVQVAAADQSDQ